MIAKLDSFIMQRVIKLAHFIDQKFHVNNYYVASYIIRLVQFCTMGLLVVFKETGITGWTLAVFCLIYLPLLWVLNMERKNFQRAGWKWERSPGTIPTEVYGQIVAPSFTRIMPIFIAVIVTIPNVASAFILHPWYVGTLALIVWPWNGYSAMASYFAAIPPYRGKRDPKKVRDWSFGLKPKLAGSAFLCLSLAACANDRYSVTTGDPVAMGPSLKACKKEALDRYFASQDQSGALVAGAAFGAIGGLIYGAASKPKDDPNVYVETCMKQHGYEGTSEN